MNYTKYANTVVLPGWNSPYGAGNVRWDGQMVDAILRAERNLRTVSFVDPSTALAVLMANGRVRKNKRRARVGDVVFLSRENYVGVVVGAGPSRDYLQVVVGWLDAGQGKRSSAVKTLHLDIDILAVADPDLKVYERSDPPTVSITDRKRISSLLHAHPAVGVFVPEDNFASAYARWQRYCGMPANKVTGRVDADSLERLTRESS